MTIQRGDLTNNPAEIVEVTYKGLSLVVVDGDITSRLSHVDAMVIPSSPELDRQMGAVENAVYSRFGNGPFEAVDRKKAEIGFTGPIAMGQAVGVESGGNKFVFVNIQPEGRSGEQTPEAVKDSAINCFVEASKLNCNSIAIPALGNGMWGVPLGSSARAIADAVRSYVDMMEGERQNLKRVELVLFRPSPEDRRAIVAPIKTLTSGVNV